MQAGLVKTRFVLTMKNCVVDGKEIKEITITWINDMSSDEAINLSEKGITTKNFLMNRMVGLNRLGESILTIEPLGQLTTD